MIKNSLFFLLLTLFLAGCAENGSIIEVPSAKQTMVENNTSTTETEQINNSDNNSSAEIIDIENKEETFFDDATMNTISGALVLIIGILILL